MGTKKVNRFSLLLIVVGVFGCLMVASCKQQGRIGAVIQSPDINSKSSLGDVIVVLKQEGRIRYLHTLSGFERIPLRVFTYKKRKFDEIVFLALPEEGVSVRWSLLIDNKLYDMPLSVGSRLSIPATYISDLLKAKSQITISSKFFIQNTAIE